MKILDEEQSGKLKISPNNQYRAESSPTTTTPTTPATPTTPTTPVREDFSHSKLNIYTLSKFAQRGWLFPVESKLCVDTRSVEPGFKICVYEPANDVWVSRHIVSQGYWESEMADWLNRMLIGGLEEVLYVDVGANLGIHGLHAAKANCTVWSV